MSKLPRGNTGQVQSPDQLEYVGNSSNKDTPSTYHAWTDEITITPVKRTDSSVKEQRQQALSTAKEKAKNDLKKILAKHGHDFKSARKNEKLWKKVNAAYKKRARKYFQEIVSSRQNNRSNVKNQILQVNPKWDSIGGIKLDHIHATLDVAGLIPVLGIAPDAVNTLLYLFKGDFENAAFSAVAILPGGQIATATKYSRKVLKELAERTAKLSTSDQKKVRNTLKELVKHEEKLKAYRKNPDAYDNKGFLKNAPSEKVRQRIIDGRVRHLEKEIETFQKEIKKTLDKGN